MGISLKVLDFTLTGMIQFKKMIKQGIYRITKGQILIIPISIIVVIIVRSVYNG